MLSLVLSFLISLFITLMLVRYAHLHQHLSADSYLNGVQKFHARPVPRIGGLAILIGFIFSAAQLRQNYFAISNAILLLAACSLPAFLSGFVEDLTKCVTPRIRLLCTMGAALAAYYALGIHINRLDIAPLYGLFSYPLLVIILTVLAVAGLANAINIIDGFNGLASMVALMMFGSLAYVAFRVSEPIVLSASLMMMGAILGFFVWNFPAGLIFLGDGGAYFIGFMLGELSILLVMRHPEVSAWYPVLIAIYPIFETGFSIYRKYWVRGMSPSVPDGVHLHMLIYKRLMRWAVGATHAQALTHRNSFTSPYLWLLCLCAVIPATLFWQYTELLIFFVVAFGAIYIWLYLSIVRFRVPRWLIYRRRSH